VSHAARAFPVSRLLPLSQAVAELVRDGDTVAMEGFTHLVPHAAGHELIRQNRKDLTLLRMTPDIIYDQLIGVGAVRTLVFSWGGNPGVGSLHRFRDAVERGWPHAIELVEHTHATMAAAYAAGAASLPFAPMLPTATETTGRNAQLAEIVCPFTGQSLLAVAAHRPDVTVIHAQRADRHGNVQLWGITGVQKEAALAARRVLVTVEEVVDRLDRLPGDVILPAAVVTAVCDVPNGAHPSYALGYSQRDNAFYRAWDDISRDRNRFLAWIDRHVRGTRSMKQFLASIQSEFVPS
jgi:glutaconate CoA-transferase subunit A